MEFTEIGVLLRFSEDTKQGAWRTIELSGKATLGPGEDAGDCYQQMFKMVKGKLSEIWSRPVKDQTPELPAEEQHWCAEHGQAFVKREKNGHVWYSHQLAFESGKYCQEG